jgi:hypothetical protein
VEDLDREVLAALSEHLFLLLTEDLAGSVMRINNAIAYLEFDMGGRYGGLKVIQLLFR